MLMINLIPTQSRRLMADDVLSALAAVHLYLRVLCGNHRRVHYLPWREGPQLVLMTSSSISTVMTAWDMGWMEAVMTTRDGY